MKVCKDCRQPEGEPHRQWCGMEYMRQVKKEVWRDAYGQGVHDTFMSVDAGLPGYGPARVNPFSDDSDLYEEERDDDD